jgi:hypothetical protein
MEPEKKEEKKKSSLYLLESVMDYPKISIFLTILGLIWVVISVSWWGFLHKDISQLVPNTAVGFGLWFVAYVAWYTKNNDKFRGNISKMHDSLVTEVNSISERVKFLEKNGI